MDRIKHKERFNSESTWDVVVIGGGATGLGVALDAQLRGFKTLLLEREDFAKGTSSRSTKLVHGGVRYLAQGDVSLVREALRERGRLLANAPQICTPMPFVIPAQSWFSAAFYMFGLWLYDRLSGKLSIGKTEWLGKDKAYRALPGVQQDKIKYGVRYFDGQFDDTRLAITLAKTFAAAGGTLLNYAEVTALHKTDGKVSGVAVHDRTDGQQFDIRARCIINATGVFSDNILQMDAPEQRRTIMPSQGVHIVLDRDFLPGDEALMVPKTSDGRVLFAVPWHEKIIVGTTDTLIEEPMYEPPVLEKEITFLLDTAAEYLDRAPTRDDIKSVYVGLRPLAAPEKEGESTKEISRSHKVEHSASGLVTISGGKWTTYRQMAEDTIDHAIEHGLLSAADCKTYEHRLHGYAQHRSDDVLGWYGSNADKIRTIAKEKPQAAQRIHPEYPYIYAQVDWAVKEEMAITLEDVLARRIRLLFTDADAVAQVAQSVAQYMAELNNQDQSWIDTQVAEMTEMARHYQMPGAATAPADQSSLGD